MKKQMILLMICEYFDISLGELVSRRKTEPLVFYRQIAYRLLNENGYNTVEVGEIMNRSYSTIIQQRSMNNPYENDYIYLKSLIKDVAFSPRKDMSNFLS